jgi:hypothetical protein
VALGALIKPDCFSDEAQQEPFGAGGAKVSARQYVVSLKLLGAGRLLLDFFLTGFPG